MELHQKRIFVVEDNLENRIITRMILGRSGGILEFEAWGKNTIAHLKAFASVDLILLDLMLSVGVDGYRIFDQIRSVHEFAHIPIVAVSASDPAVAIPRCKEKGFNGFIAKPVDDDLLPLQLAKVLQGQQIWYSGIGALS